MTIEIVTHNGKFLIRRTNNWLLRIWHMSKYCYLRPSLSWVPKDDICFPLCVCSSIDEAQYWWTELVKYKDKATPEDRYEVVRTLQDYSFE
jgi:hypothetical protein